MELGLYINWEKLLLNDLVRLLQMLCAVFPKNIHQRRQNYNRVVHLYVFVEVDGLVVDVVAHEEVVDAGQERHLRQGEYVHELFHGVAMGTLPGSD